MYYIALFLCKQQKKLFLPIIFNESLLCYCNESGLNKRLIGNG